MDQSGDRRRRLARISGELYGRDYYFGQSSGYPAEGYQVLRHQWHDWMGLITQIKSPPGVFVDLGCAFGYLVATAREAGYEACGCDISSYALQQEEELTPHLIQANAQELPFPAGEADVVALFDVLEHLDRPEHCLREALRLLKPEGLLIGTTPDPIFFNRTEETHCFERPPSYWLFLLQELGMRFQFRFSTHAYNFQFVAARPGSATADRLKLLQYDYFSDEPEFITLNSRDQTGNVYAVPRSGWGPRVDDSRSLSDHHASIYLLNNRLEPGRFRIQFKLEHSSAFSTLRIRLDSYVLEEVQLSSEKTSHLIEIDDLLVPAGGHHLFFDLFPGGPEVTIASVQIEIDSGKASELTSTLPFDLQQRYRLAGEVAEILKPRTLLDVGGYLGDQDGHLATSADFLRASGIQSVVTTDIRHCDHPFHLPNEAAEQPFPSNAFDLVVSLDVLEHVPNQQRADYLRELDRVSSQWILLGAPFSSKSVEDLETSLANQLDLGFLREHRQCGLPSHSLIEDFFVDQRGYSIKAIPNGYLPTWGTLQLLTQLLHSIRDHRAIKAFNRLYARHLYPADQRVPSYRTVYLISKLRLSPAILSQMDSILVRSSKSAAGAEAFLLDRDLASIIGLIKPVLAARDKALSDVQFLINERQVAINSLTERNQALLSMPIWRMTLKRIRRRLSGRHSE